MKKELVIVVDENNEVIGHKDRKNLDYSKDIIRSTALWITNSKNEVLLAQRAFSKDKDPGVWGPATAGTVEKGETYDSNVIKEAEEEIGLSGVDFNKSELHFFQGTKRQFVQWFTFQTDADITTFTKQDDEVEQIAWVPMDQFLDDFKKNPENYVPSFKESLKFLVK